jgi:hypothetical protein
VSEFATITSEGGLLPPDLLARIASLDKTVPGLSAADYRLDEGQRHGEAISRSWSRLVPIWRAFRAELAKLPDEDPATSLTRDRFLQPLLQELGYGRVPTAKALEVDGRSYAISHAWGDTPIHLLGARVSLETRTVGQAGAAKSSPHGLVQDLLNRSEPHLWALLSNGLVLRLLRDHHSLTSQAYVEVDLEALFEGERYADFLLMWLMFHQSRIEPRAGRVDQCWLEQWFALSREQGLAALDDLRDGVVAAIEALGKGFLRHPHNQTLHRDLSDGALDKQDYYRELLRLAYRLIFLFSAEDRGVLLDPAATDVARDRYRRFYATHRLRDLAGKSRGGPHGDLWQVLRAVMNGLSDGCAPLALPALGSFLWEREALPHLDRCDLANTDLLAAIRALSYLERHKQRFPVSWRTVAADELGSIYESLLELHPKLDAGAGTFELNTAAGNERKKTGSYYTPTSLVDCLLDSALDPVIEAAAKGKSRSDAEAALLALKIVDPACGSGHFLVAAARRLARRLARVRTGDDEPSPREFQHAIRDVVGRCIYGVDLNDMAVELCKVALWMEAVEPGKPLSFLDAHIQHGNALIGATPALITRGIPDDAWDPIEGDDKAVAKALKKRNREARNAAEKAGQGDMFAVVSSPGGTGDLATAARDALAGSDDVVADIRARKRRWEALQNSQSFEDAMRVADTCCAAFVWPKKEGPLAAEAPTTDAFARIRKEPAAASKPLRLVVGKLAGEYTFFHWHLAFPEVFTPRGATADDHLFGVDGGFDCVLGNPPWERVKLQEKEFFAGKHDEIANAENASLRKKLINKLPETDPTLWEAWVQSSRQAEGESHWLRQSGRYPLCGQGDINTYSLFAELMRTLLSPCGRVGVIVPSGIATDDSTKAFFGDVVTRAQLVSLLDFQSGPGLFAEVGHARFKFCLLTLRRVGDSAAPIELVFFARDVAHLRDPERRVVLTAEDFLALNPNTRTCPTFRWRRDAELNKAIYRRVSVLWREADESTGNPWGIKFLRMLDMAGDSDDFKSRAQCESDDYRLIGNVFEHADVRCVPLYEAKMIHHFDHRFGDYRDRPEESESTALPEVPAERLDDPNYRPHPKYWVDQEVVTERLKGRWTRSWLLGWRDICRSSDMRTVITAVIPRVAVGDKFLLVLPSVAHFSLSACLLANLASLVFDYCARQKVGGTSLKYYVMKQLPALPPTALIARAPWSRKETLCDWLSPRVVELSYTAHDMAGFAADCGFACPPFHWNPERRTILRAELDAAFFHLYGLDRSDTEYILDTFPVLRDKEIREDGEYHTKRLVLERYDALAAAIVSVTPYVSPLSPPPADPGVTHPSREVEILPLRRRGPPPRPLPAWGHEIFAEVETRTEIALKPDAWSTNLSGEQLGISALAAVLRGLPASTAREDVERAVVLVVLPRLMQPHFEGASTKRWRSVVGKKDLAVASVTALAIPWGNVLRKAIQQRVLAEGLNGLWHAGPDVGDAPAPALDARALVVLSWLATAPAQDATVEQELGDLRVA